MASDHAGPRFERRRKGASVDDTTIHSSIEQLVSEEHELWEKEARGASQDSDRRRLEELRVTLDQCWDMLRQRRALREAGLDPEGAHARPEETVEHYQQ
jgi:hypothetical protein